MKTNSFNLMSDPSKFVTDSGKEIDLHNAYRRLSDAALLRSGGTLSTLGERNLSDPMRGETIAPGGGMRMQKDVLGEAEEEAVNSTDDEVDSDESFLNEAWSGRHHRGRGRTRKSKPQSTGENSASPGKEDSAPKSLLAAAEDERKLYEIKNALIEFTGILAEHDQGKGYRRHRKFDLYWNLKSQLLAQMAKNLLCSLTKDLVYIQLLALISDLAFQRQ